MYVQSFSDKKDQIKSSFFFLISNNILCSALNTMILLLFVHIFSRIDTPSRFSAVFLKKGDNFVITYLLLQRHTSL